MAQTAPPTFRLILMRYNMSPPPAWGRGARAHLDPGWLARRRHLFETYCWPSLRAQTLWDFTLLLFVDARTDPEEVAALTVDSRIVPMRTRPDIDSAEEMLEEVQAGVRRHLDACHPAPPPGALLATTRLDSDDALAPHYLERLDAALRRTAVSAEGAYFNFPLGQQYVVATESYRSYLYTRTAFGTYVEPLNGGPVRTVMYREHTRMIELDTVVTVDGERPGWCMVIHGDNVSNNERGTPVAVPGFRLPGAREIALAHGRRAPVSRDHRLRRAAPPRSRHPDEARMSNEISAPAQTAPHSPTLEIVTPLSTRMLFWRARYLRKSPFLHHLPFLFWLIEVCRPKSYVELGVGEGVSYFAACQALDKLDSDAHCHGIDTWAETESGTIPEAVRNHNAEQFADFSRLVHEDPRAAVHRFPNGSIDLLHVDMDPDESLLDSLTHDWKCKLSRRGVVLLHGVTTRFAEGPARSFLERITAAYPTVMLEGGDGLLAVLYGAEREARLAKLARLSLGMPGYTEVHRVFSRLGATHHYEWASRAEAGKAAAARRKQEAADKALEDAETQRAQVEEKLAVRDAAYDARSAQIAELQARLFDLQQAHDARGAELDGLRAEREQERRDHAETLAARDAALAEARREVEEKNATLEQERQEHRRRFDELAELTRAHEERARTLAERTAQGDAAQRDAENLRAEREQERRDHAETLAARDAALTETRRELEDKTATLAAETDKLEARFQEIATLTQIAERHEQRVRELDEELAHTRAHRDALLNSTFWKLTAPARRTVETMRAVRARGG